MERLADTLKCFDEFLEALKLEEEILERRCAVLGVGHLDTLKAMENLALSYVRLENWEEGMIYAKKGWEGRRSSSGEHHPSTVNSAFFYFHCLDHLGRIEEAQEVLQSLLWLVGSNESDLPPELHRIRSIIIKITQKD